MPKMSVTELQAILQAEKSDALGAMEAAELSDQRSKAMEYYLSEETLDGDMPPPPDRSRAVSSDVADTVEGLMPSLMEIFASGDDIVEFEPVGIEDEEAARQETDYVNHVFWHRNHGFLVLYTFVKDALLQKNGIVKVWWEEKEESEEEIYEDLSDDAYALIAASPDIEIVKHEERQEPVPAPPPMPMPATPPMMPGGPMPLNAGMPPQQPMLPPEPQYITLHNITVVTKRTYGCCKVEPVPPEEFGITRRARSIHIGDSDYVYHETRQTESELKAQGYDPLQVESLPDAGDDDTEESQSRDTVDDNQDLALASANKATRTIRVTEHYVKLDYEGDGKPKLYKVVTGAGTNEVLRKKVEEPAPYEVEQPEDNPELDEDAGADEVKTDTRYKPDIEPVDLNPFAAMTPIIMTHRFFGRSVADLVMDIMRIKTALTRSGLDSIYLANNQRIEIAESHATDKTLDDLLTNRPGGIVRTKNPGGLLPIPNQDISTVVYPMLQYQDTVREWRTGVTRQGQGIDAKSLADQSATASAQLFTMAQARMRLIARIFAETGIRDLFTLMHATIRKHGRSQQDTIRLRNKWVKIDPRNWKTRNDMTVNVGISAGSKMEQAAFLINMLGIQKEAVAHPEMGLANPGNIYSTLKRLVQIGNLKSIEPYFTDPDAKGPDGKPINRKPPPPNPDQMEAEARMKLEAAKLEADKAKGAAQIQLQQQKDAAQAQSDREKAAADIQLQREKMASEMQLRREQMAAEMALKDRQLQAELAMKREQLIAELALKRELGMVNAAASAMPNAGQVNVGGEPG